jgi:adenine/guanine phosphoribosyltransferase-like PRPP-binding protein
MTTGGTLEAAAKALQAKGHLVVAVAVVAHVPTAIRAPVPLLRQRDYAGGYHPHAKNVS